VLDFVTHEYVSIGLPCLSFPVLRRRPPRPTPFPSPTLCRSEHAIPRGLPNVMIEIRNDLLNDADAQHAMAMRLAGYIKSALANLETSQSDALKHEEAS